MILQTLLDAVFSRAELLPRNNIGVRDNSACRELKCRRGGDIISAIQITTKVQSPALASPRGVPGGESRLKQSAERGVVLIAERHRVKVSRRTAMETG